MTPTMLQKVAQKAYNVYFASESHLKHLDLTKIQFTCSKKMSQCLGLHIYKKATNTHTIRIAEVITNSEKDLMDTMVHELIHAAEVQKFHCRASHGAWFKLVSALIHRAHPEMNVSRCGAPSTQVMQKIAEKKVSRTITKNIYAILRNKKWNFFTEKYIIGAKEIAILKAAGARIYPVKDLIEATKLRKSRSLQDAIQAKYYYQPILISKIPSLLGPEL